MEEKTQLELAQEQLIKFFAFLQEKHSPNLSLFEHATIVKDSKQFLLEQEAIRLLDESAVNEGKGYLNAADKYAKEENARKKKDAETLAFERAKANAAQAEADAALNAQLLEDRRKQLERDEEDARIAAERKAQKLAGVEGKNISDMTLSETKEVLHNLNTQNEAI